MAQSDKIKSSEVVQSDLFKDLKKSSKEALEQLSSLEQGFISLIKVQKTAARANPLKTGKDLREANKLIEETTKTTAALNEVKKVQLKLTEEQQAYDERARKIQRERIELIKANQILENKNVNILVRLNAENVKLRNNINNVTGSEKQQTEQILKWNKQLDLNNTKIKSLSDSLKQSKLNVGNYTASIRAALAETGAFDNGLVRAIATLRNLKNNLAAGQEGASKLSLVLKGALALGIVAVVSGLVSLAKINQNVVDGFNGAIAGAKDFGIQLITLGKQQSGYREALQGEIALRGTLITLEEQMQQARLDSEDALQKSNDTTLGFKERNDNLELYLTLRKEELSLQVGIARERAKQATREKNASGGKNPSFDLVKAEADANLALKAAKDIFEDFSNIDSPELRRKRAAAQLSIAEDLIRSKKRSSTIERDLLENQVNDEKRQIEQRKQDQKDLTEVYKQTFDEQIRLFEDSTGRRVNANKLILETDAVALAEQIKGLQLGEEQTVILATIIKKAQDDKVKSIEQSTKIQEKEIENLKQIAAFESQIAQIKRNDAVNDIEFSKQKAEIESNLAIKTFEGNRSRSNLGKVKESLSAEKVINDSLYEQKIKNLDAQRIADENAAKSKVQQAEVTTAELKLIEEQYWIDLGNLQQEGTASSEEIARKNANILLDIEKQKNQQLIQNAATLTNSFGEEIDKRSQKQQKAYDLELQHREENIQLQQQLAVEGRDNQLAFEKAQQAKTELARKDAEEKAQKDKERLQLVEAYFNAYNIRMSKEGSNPTQAAAQAFGDVLLAKGIARGLQFAQEGNEDVRPLAGGVGIKGKDTIPFMLEQHEGVVMAEANIKHKGVVKALNSGTFDQMYLPKSKLGEVAAKAEQSSMERAYKAMFIQENKEVVDLLKKIEAKPTQIIDVDKFGNFIETVRKDGMDIITKHINSNRIG